MKITGCVALAATIGTCLAQDIVAVQFSGDSYAINSATGMGGLLGPSGFTFLNAMARVGSIYFTSNNLGTLISIDPNTGAGVAVVATVPALTSIRGLAEIGGVLYAISSVASTAVNDTLYTINPVTGVAALVGTTVGFSGLQGLASDTSGTLYGWDITQGLVTINPATAATTDVNPAVGSSGAMIQCLAFSPSGTLYGAEDSLYTINTGSGVPALVGTGGYTDIRGIEFRSKAKIYCNGPMVTHPGAGPGGGDASAVQTALGMATFGTNANFNIQNDVKDDFFTNGPWQLGCICLYAYQVGAMAPTINGVHVAIYDNNPNAGGMPVQGSPNFNNDLFMAAGYVTTVTMTDTWRVTDSNLLQTARRIQKVTIVLPAPIPLDSSTLVAGRRYWIRWSFTGTLATGPLVPHVTTLGVTTTGNAEATFAGTRSPIIDVGPQALPFDFLGTSSGMEGEIRNIGGGCGPAGRDLDVRGAPVAGGTIFAELTGAGALTLPGIIVGLSDPSAPFPACTCILHASLDFLFVPAATLELRIPNSLSVVRSRIYVQGFQLDFTGLAGLPCNLGSGLDFKLTDAYCVQLW